MVRVLGPMALAVGTIVCLAGIASAQQTSSATETKAFEVIAVEGNQLVVRLPEGTRELTVPGDFRFTVDGKQLSVQELKPGMKGTATITTKTTVTPVTVTQVKNGTVMQASGASITVRTDEGIKMFTQGDVDKRGVKIVREGRPAQISDFHAGDTLSATIVTSYPPKVVTEKEVQATLARGAAPASRPAAAATATAGAQAAAPSGGQAASMAAPGSQSSSTRTLPKTASPFPLLGLVGLTSLVSAATLAVRRRRLTR